MASCSRRNDRHFETFQKFTDRLSIESQDLKTRLENERRSHKRLSGVVNEQQAKQVELEHRLLETEHAWMAAQVELAKAHELRDELERQKDIMVRPFPRSPSLKAHEGE